MNRPLYILGDVHALFDDLIDGVKKFDIRESDIIQVGDFGAWMHKKDSEIGKTKEESLRSLDKELVDRYIYLYVIRGNHDNPKLFQEHEIDPYQNIKFLPDYTVKSLGGRNILFVGGAISIDRKKRTEGAGWYASEEFVLRDVSNVRDIDTVVTHTAPNFCNPQTRGSLVDHYVDEYGDDTLIEELKTERLNMTLLYHALSENNAISDWYYGHFHFSYRAPTNETTFCCLGVEEMLEITKRS